ncbi:hypothetical protein [Paludisphaera sp.]|uniref:hypothetical protein n=1 Tax=Paludisphaera sp. TaxID=2017432 RepID=UPI00301D26D4
MADRSHDSSLENIRSIGLRSGLYGGRNRNSAPAAAISRAASAVLWQARLSITTTSPGFSVGARHLST